MSERIERVERHEIIKDENSKITIDTEQTIQIHDDSGVQPQTATTQNRLISWLAVLLAVLLIGGAGLWWINSRQSAASNHEAAEKTEGKEHGEAGHVAGEKAGEHAEGDEHGAEIKLEPATLRSAGIEMEGVTSRPAIALLKTTGSIENNPQNTQSVSPLVGGRIESITVRVGDSVSKGALLAVIASPEIAEMHGKMHEAETALGIAERNYQRVQKAENRVAVIAAKARLDEAEATLKRTKKLIELGAGAGKDLVSAETNYRTAKADFDFQSNISLNRELQEARAAVETARVDVRHIKDQMRALGVEQSDHDADNHSRDTALVPVRAPAAGMITERAVNPGAGVAAGTALMTISNLSSVYAVASVPETQMPLIRIGTAAEIRSAAITGAINARVAYIDPQLNEDTRTGRVRLEVPNPNNRLRAGMFVEIGFNTGTNAATGEELVVPSAAVQRIAEKTVVFVPVDGEPGTFRAETIEIGAETSGYTRVISGLELGERVVTKGSFTLKTVMQKGELGDHDH